MNPRYNQTDAQNSARLHIWMVRLSEWKRAKERYQLCDDKRCQRREKHSGTFFCTFERKKTGFKRNISPILHLPLPYSSLHLFFFFSISSFLSFVVTHTHTKVFLLFRFVYCRKEVTKKSRNIRRMNELKKGANNSLDVPFHVKHNTIHTLGEEPMKRFRLRRKADDFCSIEFAIAETIREQAKHTPNKCLWFFVTCSIHWTTSVILPPCEMDENVIHAMNKIVFIRLFDALDARCVFSPSKCV